MLPWAAWEFAVSRIIHAHDSLSRHPHLSLSVFFSPIFSHVHMLALNLSSSFRSSVLCDVVLISCTRVSVRVLGVVLCLASAHTKTRTHTQHTQIPDYHRTTQNTHNARLTEFNTRRRSLCTLRIVCTKTFIHVVLMRAFNNQYSHDWRVWTQIPHRLVRSRCLRCVVYFVI